MGPLIVGTIAFDSIETPWQKVDRILGGSGTYAGYASSFFSAPNLVGVVGEDFPQEYLNLLSEKNIGVEGVQRIDGKTFFWAGRYEEDVNVRTTLTTELNVLEKFDPVIPQAHVDSEYLFLANIDPDLQVKVLDQCTNPKFVVIDTMNFWIDIKKPALDEVFKRVDAVMLNDEEARMYCNTPNLLKAARMILEGRPKAVIVKKGEHGVMMVMKDQIFSLPGFPLETVTDPTGAGDSFAGGFIGFLAQAGNIEPETLKQAIVAGSVTASFCCEDFSIDRFKTLGGNELRERISSFKKLTDFQMPQV